MTRLRTISKRLASLALFFPVFFLYAQQDRENSALPTISENVLWSLESAKGWMKNSEGQWLESNNRIWKETMSIAEKEKWEEEENILGLDNFVKYEVREISVSGKDFLVFIKIMNDGYWEFPSLRRGFTEEKRALYTVIAKGRGSVKPYSLDETVTDFIAPTFFIGAFPYDEKYIEKIRSWVSETDQEDPEYRDYGVTVKLRILYQELKDGKSCRFLITRGGSAQNHHLMYPLKGEGHHPYRAIQEMTDYYYECDKDEISGLLELIKGENK